MREAGKSEDPDVAEPVIGRCFAPTLWLIRATLAGDAVLAPDADQLSALSP
jgi:hypothetical protein